MLLCRLIVADSHLYVRIQNYSLQAITPNIREASLEKALTELLAAKIIERCQEDRLSVAFFRNRRQDSLPQLRGQKMSYT